MSSDEERKYKLPLPQEHKCSGCRWNYIYECGKLKNNEFKKCKDFEWD